jgi:hypothetical protein
MHARRFIVPYLSVFVSVHAWLNCIVQAKGEGDASPVGRQNLVPLDIASRCPCHGQCTVRASQLPVRTVAVFFT